MIKSKTQIFYIHGGNTFKNKKDYLDFLQNSPVSIEKRISWSGDYLENKLKKNFQIIKPRMPLKEYAKYNEWKIYFEKYFPQLKNNIILIGTSLGGMFLAKYLSENKFPRKILSVYLIAPPFDNTLGEEDLSGGFKLKSDLSMIEKNCKNINIIFSKNDNIVPIAHAKKYKDKIGSANIIIFKNMNGHFFISEFPEIIKMIKKELKNLK